MILDTTFFLDLIAEDDAAVERALALERDAVPQRIPAQVVYELYVGVGYTDTPDEEAARLAGVLEGRSIVETTAAIAKRAGRIDGELRRDGERLPSSDLLIGATGLAFDEPVLTRNVDHFERIPGVTVVGY